MRVAILGPIAWRTPPRHYGPWENVVSLLTEGLVRAGVDVTLFATKDSLTSAKKAGVCRSGYEEDPTIDAKVWEGLHIAELFERAAEFDIIHNHFDFLPLTYSSLVNTPMVTTIHGFSSPRILPVYERYNDHTHYVAISAADRQKQLDYAAVIHHGIDMTQFDYSENPGNYLLFFGRIHPDKGAKEAIDIARRLGMKLIIAGIIQDRPYFEDQVEPHLDDDKIVYVGSVGPKERSLLLSEALALVHPISFAEPFGLSVVESMACGTPVVAFNRGSMPEVIADGLSGFLVDSVDEACESLLSISDINRSDCRRWVESKFTVERMTNDYIALYSAISEGRVSPRNSLGVAVGS